MGQHGMHRHDSQHEPVEKIVGGDAQERHVEEPDPSIGESAKADPVEGADPEHPKGT